MLEFMAVVTRVRIGTEPLLTQAEARRETEELLDQFRILFPNTAVVRTALRGAASYQLPWFDAHLCTYAECHGMAELISEDFKHGRLYGEEPVPECNRPLASGCDLKGRSLLCP